MRFCSNCGAELQEDAKFCPKCGHPVKQAAEAPEKELVPATVASAAVRPASPKPPTAPKAPSMPAGRRRSAPSRRRGMVRPPREEGAEPVAAPPGRPRLSGKVIAGIAGGVIILVVLALVFLLRSPGGGEQAGPSGSGGTTTSGGTEVPGTTGGQAPQSGGLRDLVQEKVGKFSLKEVKTDTDATEAGATDALTITYAAADGTNLIHDIRAWKSAGDAEGDAAGFAQFLIQEKKWKSVAEKDVQDNQGTRLGRVILLRDGKGLEVVVWSDQTLSALALSSEGNATEFYKQLPY